MLELRKEISGKFKSILLERRMLLWTWLQWKGFQKEWQLWWVEKIQHQLISCNKQLLYTYVTVPIIQFFYLNQCCRHINGCNNYNKNITHALDRFIFITTQTISSFLLCKICFDHYSFRRQRYTLCEKATYAYPFVSWIHVYRDLIWVVHKKGQLEGLAEPANMQLYIPSKENQGWKKGAYTTVF